MKKRIWAYLLTLVMVVGLLPATALAENGDEDIANVDIYTLTIPSFSEYSEYFTITNVNNATKNDDGSYTIELSNVSDGFIDFSVSFTEKSKENGIPLLCLAVFDENGERIDPVDLGGSYITWINDAEGTNSIYLKDIKTLNKNLVFNVVGLTACKIEGTEVVFTGWGETPAVRSSYSWSKQAWMNADITKVIIDDGITVISNQLLTGVSGNSSNHAWNDAIFSLPDTLETIRNYGIERINCSGVIKIPKSLKNIGKYSFAEISIKDTTELAKCVIDFTDLSDDCSFEETSFKGIANEVICYCKNENIPVSGIKAVTNGGTFAKDTAFKAGELAEPSKNGYAFKGWYTDLDDETTETKTPEAGNTYYAKWEEKAETTVTITPSVTSMRGKGTVTLTIAATPENILGNVEVSCDGGIEVTKNADGTYSAYLPNKTQTYTFTAKYAEDDTYQASSAECAVSVKKKSSSSSSSSSDTSAEKTYTISKADDMENGKVSVDLSKAEKGDKVTFTVTPDRGYEINKVTVKDADGNKIEVKEKGDGEYSFTMPDSKVEIKATFSKAEETPVVAEEAKPIILTINQRVASVFGETVINDVAPVIRNERTMLPIRFVAEALGATVAWDDAQNKVTITKGDMVIEIFIGQPFALVNGAPVELDTPAFIENDRTYLPLRFVAEHLGATVTWDAAAQTVTITSDK